MTLIKTRPDVVFSATGQGKKYMTVKNDKLGISVQLPKWPTFKSLDLKFVKNCHQALEERKRYRCKT